MGRGNDDAFAPRPRPRDPAAGDGPPPDAGDPAALERVVRDAFVEQCELRRRRGIAFDFDAVRVEGDPPARLHVVGPRLRLDASGSPFRCARGNAAQVLLGLWGHRLREIAEQVARRLGLPEPPAVTLDEVAVEVGDAVRFEMDEIEGEPLDLP